MDLDLSCFSDLSPFGIPCVCEGTGLMPPFWRLLLPLNVKYIRLYYDSIYHTPEVRDVGIKNLNLSLSQSNVSPIDQWVFIALYH